MQSSFRDRGRDLGYHHPKSSAEEIPEGEPMVLGMNSESYQANGLDNETYELNSREGPSAVGVSKKSLPANGKKTKGRVKIKMEFIDNKLRRYTTFSKRKTGIMKKAYELSTLTGTQVMLLVASETGHVYTFATRKLQPMITSEAGKALIQTCLNSPDLPPEPGASGLDQRMSATGFEETDLTYSVADDCEKMSDSPGNPVYSPEVSPSAISSGTTLLTPSLVSFTSSLPTSTNIPRVSGSKSTSFTTSTSTIAPTSNLTSPHTSLSSAGFTTILTASAAGGELSPAVQIGTFQSPESPSSPSGQRDSPPQQAIYGIPAGQSFSLAIAGGSKSQAVASTSDSSSSSHNSLSVVQGSSPNLSVVSGNVVIPQTILQANNSAVLYHTSQGLVYATPTNLPEGVVLNLGQEQGGTQQQFITIPVSLSLTPAQQQQLIQGTQGTSQGQNSSFSSSSNRREKARK